MHESIKREIAVKFGNSLDKDDFATTKSTLDIACVYVIGNDILTGPDEIVKSYEDNMIEGRKKLDKLEWGQCEIEEINEDEYYVHFTDYLTHNGIQYIHRCKQKLTVGPDNRIVKIEHIDDPLEQESLNSYYKSVGLK